MTEPCACGEPWIRDTSHTAISCTTPSLNPTMLDRLLRRNMTPLEWIAALCGGVLIGHWYWYDQVIGMMLVWAGIIAEVTFRNRRRATILGKRRPR